MTDERDDRSGGECWQEVDRLPGRALAWTGAAATGIALAAIAASALWVSAWTREEPAEARAARARPTLFRSVRSEDGPAAPLPAEPGGFAWVEREEGLVRIPPEEAMELYLEEHRP